MQQSELEIMEPETGVEEGNIKSFHWKMYESIFVA